MFWQQVHQLDQQMTLVINSWHSPFTDPIWAFFSDKIVWIPLYVAIVVFLFIRLGWKKALVVTVMAGLTICFCDQMANIAKHSVGRIRPVNDEFMNAAGLHILERGGGFSFFSAHAANSFGLAGVTYIGFKEDRKRTYRCYGYAIFFWAAMVAVSRIFVGKHYLGDVVAGTIVGIVGGLAFGYLARVVIRSFLRGKSCTA